MAEPSLLNGVNAAWVETLYESWLNDPASVDGDWRACFEGLDQAGETSTAPTRLPSESLSEVAAKQAKVLQLISALRYRGHQEADLDPLGLYEELYERPSIPDTNPEYYGFDDADMRRTFNTGSVYMAPEATLEEICSLLRDTYSRSIGTELTHVSSTEQKRWVQERLERTRGRPNFDHAKKRNILHWITAARTLEEYLHRKYVGQKRFSLEGGENLIPMLDEVIQRAGTQGVREAIIGMAHRGRLNVLVNILGKHPKTLFGEFEGKIEVGSGSGDVKYHLGFSSDVETPGGPMHLVLAFNPSHLEIINPVVEGSVRARQERRGDEEQTAVLPILVHGDAAFAGQGVVTETLNLSETRGYSTGGTIHVIVNNQIGFTTPPESSRLPLHSLLHRRGEADPPAGPAREQRRCLGRGGVCGAVGPRSIRHEVPSQDIVIDLVVLPPKYGHNEGDEPRVHQSGHGTTRSRSAIPKDLRRYFIADQLISEQGVLTQEDIEYRQPRHGPRATWIRSSTRNHGMSRGSRAGSSAGVRRPDWKGLFRQLSWRDHRPSPSSRTKVIGSHPADGDVPLRLTEECRTASPPTGSSSGSSRSARCDG